MRAALGGLALSVAGCSGGSGPLPVGASDAGPGAPRATSVDAGEPVAPMDAGAAGSADADRGTVGSSGPDASGAPDASAGPDAGGPQATALVNPAPASRFFIGTNFWNIDWEGQDDFFQKGIDFATVTDPWRPELLADLAPYAVLRFMDWNQTNDSNNAQASWDTRKQKTQPQGEPVAFEWQIDLCNRAKKDYWLNLPHEAKADLWQKVAQLVHDQLDPSLRVYVEWSNEVWNSSFPQNKYAADQATTLGLSGNTPAIAYQVYESVRAFEAFEAIFGQGSPRLVKVIAGQAAWTGPCDAQMTAFADASINPHHTRADAYAIAPYFSGTSIQDLHTSVSTVVQWTQSSFTCASGGGLPLIAYEGGFGLLLGGQRLRDAPARSGDARSVRELSRRHRRCQARRALHAVHAHGHMLGPQGEDGRHPRHLSEIRRRRRLADRAPLAPRRRLLDRQGVKTPRRFSEASSAITLASWRLGDPDSLAVGRAAPPPPPTGAQDTPSIVPSQAPKACYAFAAAAVAGVTRNGKRSRTSPRRGSHQRGARAPAERQGGRGLRRPLRRTGRRGEGLQGPRAAQLQEQRRVQGGARGAQHAHPARDGPRLEVRQGGGGGRLEVGRGGRALQAPRRRACASRRRCSSSTACC